MFVYLKYKNVNYYYYCVCDFVSTVSKVRVQFTHFWALIAKIKWSDLKSLLFDPVLSLGTPLSDDEVNKPAGPALSDVRNGRMITHRVLMTWRFLSDQHFCRGGVSMPSSDFRGLGSLKIQTGSDAPCVCVLITTVLPMLSCPQSKQISFHSFVGWCIIFKRLGFQSLLMQ